LDPQLLALLPSGYSAAIGLFEIGELKPGETVLITAAAGGAGHLAVQLAKNHGCHVIGTCGGADKVDLLRSLGCDRVINYRDEDKDAVMRAEYPRGVDVALDGVGGSMFDFCTSHLAVRGRLVVIGYMEEYDSGPLVVPHPRIYAKIFFKSASVRTFIVPHHYAVVPKYRNLCLQQLAEGRLRPMLDTTQFVGLGSICDAVEHQKSGRNCGKAYVRVREQSQ
jgi:NADPH-dependent curcumin reductase CurA